METVEFSLSDVRELNRQCFTLYKFFSTVISKNTSPDKRPSTPTDEVECFLRPWLKYVYRDINVQILIHRHRDCTYSIEALGLVLTKIPPHKRRSPSSDYRYQNYYGNYSDLSSCVTAWNTVVKQYVNNQLGEMF